MKRECVYCIALYKFTVAYSILIPELVIVLLVYPKDGEGDLCCVTMYTHSDITGSVFL